LIVIAACAGLLHDAMVLTSQLLVIVPRAAAASSWPFDPAQARVAFYREMSDLHDEITNILYPPEREIDEADEAIASEASLPPVRLPVVPVNLQERTPVEQILPRPIAAEAPREAVPEPKRDTGPALDQRHSDDEAQAERANVRSHHRTSRRARRHHG
jgi:hypothetical protein